MIKSLCIAHITNKLKVLDNLKDELFYPKKQKLYILLFKTVLSINKYQKYAGARNRDIFRILNNAIKLIFKIICFR